MNKHELHATYTGPPTAPPAGTGSATTVRCGSPSDPLVWPPDSPWWRRYDLGTTTDYLLWEAEADRVCEWAVLRVPDLLHTPEYTRGLLLADRVVHTEHMIGGSLDQAGARRLHDETDSRRHRQNRLFGPTDRRLAYSVVVEEAALRRIVGSPQVMHDQLLDLLDYAGSARVTLRVAPEKAQAQPGTDGGFCLLEFPDSTGHEPMMFAHYPGGVVSETAPHVIDQARQRWDAVLATALPEPDSVEFIEQLADQLYPQLHDESSGPLPE